MKNNIIKISTFAISLVFFSSCSMKDCKCISKKVISENDSIVEVIIDDVKNNSRHHCENLNKEETMILDSVRTIDYSLVCIEE